jgi:hypothetical protein
LADNFGDENKLKKDYKVAHKWKETEQVNGFLYLGSIITYDGGATEDVKSHIRRANGVFVQM